MPDLSIMIQIAEYYNVEIKELLDGERKSEDMEKELKETLLKVADYSELQRRKAAAALVLGGMVYIILLVRDGAWENGTVCKSTRKRNLARSLVCSGVFAVIFLFMMKRRFDSERAVWMAVCFFAVFTAVTYAVLQGLAFLGRKRENDLKEQSIR